jgi:hypothetical protein
MTRSRSIVLATFRTSLPAGLLIALLALVTPEARSGPCTSGWETFDEPQTNVVYAVCEYNGDVYRGGWFSFFRWDGTGWEILDVGGDMGSLFVADFALYEGDLALGGYFPTAGGIPVFSIATWDGAAFAPVGGGVDGEIRALTVYGGDLIAGGSFDNTGSGPAQNVARWDGSMWHPLGSGVSAAIWDMVVWQGDLYVVGDFTDAGGVGVSYLARWDGSGWFDVGGGVSLIGGGPTGLRGVDVHDGSLAIVGAFDFAGGVEANNVALWDGVHWSAVGSGPDPYDDLFGERQAALAVASYGELLYVGADFSEAVSDEAAALAVWDGQAWSPVDHGLEGGGWPFGPQVRDLELGGGSLLIGGDFSEANRMDTDNVARYTDCDAATDVVIARQPDESLRVHLYPNPTTSTIYWSIRLERQSDVTAALLDVTGRKVDSVLDRPLEAGIHRFQHDLRGVNATAGGVYFLRIDAERASVTRKLTLVR